MTNDPAIETPTGLAKLLDTDDIPAQVSDEPLLGCDVGGCR